MSPIGNNNDSDPLDCEDTVRMNSEDRDAGAAGERSSPAHCGGAIRSEIVSRGSQRWLHCENQTGADLNRVHIVSTSEPEFLSAWHEDESREMELLPESEKCSISFAVPGSAERHLLVYRIPEPARAGSIAVKGAADVKGTINIQSESSIDAEIRDAADVNNINIVHKSNPTRRDVSSWERCVYGIDPRIYRQTPEYIHICTAPEIVLGRDEDCDWTLLPRADDGRRIYRDKHNARVLLADEDGKGAEELRCAISRRHCTLRYLAGGFMEIMDGTADKGSKRGVFVAEGTDAQRLRRIDRIYDRNQLPLTLRLGKSRDPEQTVILQAFPIKLDSKQQCIALLRENPSGSELFIWNPAAPDIHFINPDEEIFLPTWFRQEGLYSVKRTEIGYSWVSNSKTSASKTSLYENCRIETTQGTKLTVARCRQYLLSLKIG